MRIVTALTAIVAALIVAAWGAGAVPAAGPGWEAVWATAIHRPSVSFAPNWSEEGFSNQTVRQTIRVSDGGPVLRVRLSNGYGTQPVEVTGATIARSAGGAAIRPESVQHLTVGLNSTFRLAPGAEVATDPVVLAVAPLEELTVTLFFAQPTGPATYHAQAQGTTYRAGGDHRAAASGAAFTETSTSWYFLSAVETADLAGRPGVALFGDSITDGYGSTPDARNTYPDEFAEILAGQGQSRPVLNLGIGGNRVTVDSRFLGDSAVSRFRRDVIAQPGVDTVVILEGINDIGLSGGSIPIGAPFPVVTAADLIAGHRQLIAEARAAGLRVVGTTLLPFGGSDYYTAAREEVREAVDAWIRASGEYDAIVDLDAALTDPSDSDRLDPRFDVGDHLHPSDAGYAAMAAALAAGITR
ncbi:SGNH/GDSL hydrolase family protein [Nocardia crassostreae]|uniref:SGNH/GDSL hydrolase family protein n=1 Tax=Nocardia crassostreae TaxID=53428 RepID=UPI00082F5DB7|nr:SGNH/GDSL hydrolase family protein [Nocardia crassostreae]